MTSRSRRNSSGSKNRDDGTGVLSASTVSQPRATATVQPALPDDAFAMLERRVEIIGAASMLPAAAIRGFKKKY